MTKATAAATAPEPEPKRTLYIVGFAPSWTDTPWDDPNGDYWGLNALHKVAPDKRWSAWFQLHDVNKHHAEDLLEHLGWMASFSGPVYMFPEHIAALPHPLPNAAPYPVDQVLDTFGTYFTNSVSWMIALAILTGRYNKIAIYGIDMAQDEEYIHQRPSVEYFIGWAQGAGIRIEIPVTSDLLKSPYLYGLEEEHMAQLRAKFLARRDDLQRRKAEVENVLNQNQAVLHQIVGALEDVSFWLRTYTFPTPPPTKRSES